MRAGFDAYLRGDPGRALLWYAEAAETGTDVAAANAAWLLDRDTELRALVGSKTMPLAIRFHRLASTLDGGGDGYAALGDAVLNGALVVPPGVDEGRAVSDDTISRLLETRHARALSYYSRAAQKGSARGAFAAARVRSKGAPGVRRDRKLAHKLFDDALRADPERMRWPVFVARAQLRCEEFWDDLRGSSPRRSRGNMKLSIAVAVVVVVQRRVHRLDQSYIRRVQVVISLLALGHRVVLLPLLLDANVVPTLNRYELEWFWFWIVMVLVLDCNGFGFG